MLGWFKKKLGKRQEADRPAPESGAPAEKAAAAAAETEDAAPEPQEETAPPAPPAPPPPAAEAEEDAREDGPQDTPPEPSAGQSAQAPREEPEGKQRRPGLFRRLAERLSKTRANLVSRLDAVFLGRKTIDAELFDELEEVLVTADLGVRTTLAVLDEARRRVKRDKLSDPAALKEVLKTILLEYLEEVDRPAELVMPDEGPFVIMVLGVNGVGKTTTIGKLAWKFKQAGQKVLLVAADTFRAAAIDQLKVWAERVGVDIVAQQQGADPSSVVFDALDYARPRDFDVVIIDTAGRLHTKVNLMAELQKIRRVIGKKIPGAPHETMLVVDATTGQNGISQARLFNEAVEITGLTLTKLDGTAKGGIVINICRECKIPIRFIGIGEQMEDLRDFAPQEFIDALFATGERG